MQQGSSTQQMHETPKAWNPLSPGKEEKEAQEVSKAELLHTIPLPLPPSLQFNTSTPVFLRRIVSPSNLVLDSEHSSAAEWSFSMATPFHCQTVKETPNLASCVSEATSVATSCPTVREKVLDTPTTDESASELKYREYKKQTSRRRRRSPANDKPVVRTLFPASPFILSSSTPSGGNVGDNVGEHQEADCSQDMFASPLACATPPYEGGVGDVVVAKLMPKIQEEVVECVPGSPLAKAEIHSGNVGLTSPKQQSTSKKSFKEIKEASPELDYIPQSPMGDLVSSNTNSLPATPRILTSSNKNVSPTLMNILPPSIQTNSTLKFDSIPQSPGSPTRVPHSPDTNKSVLTPKLNSVSQLSNVNVICSTPLEGMLTSVPQSPGIEMTPRLNPVPLSPEIEGQPEVTPRRSSVPLSPENRMAPKLNSVSQKFLSHSTPQHDQLNSGSQLSYSSNAIPESPGIEVVPGTPLEGMMNSTPQSPCGGEKSPRVLPPDNRSKNEQLPSVVKQQALEVPSPSATEPFVEDLLSQVHGELTQACECSPSPEAKMPCGGAVVCLTGSSCGADNSSRGKEGGHSCGSGTAGQADGRLPCLERTDEGNDSMEGNRGVDFDQGGGGGGREGGKGGMSTSGEDMLDILFMSSSQLETHISSLCTPPPPSPHPSLQAPLPHPLQPLAQSAPAVQPSSPPQSLLPSSPPAPQQSASPQLPVTLPDSLQAEESALPHPLLTKEATPPLSLESSLLHPLRAEESSPPHPLPTKKSPPPLPLKSFQLLAKESAPPYLLSTEEATESSPPHPLAAKESGPPHPVSTKEATPPLPLEPSPPHPLAAKESSPPHPVSTKEATPPLPLESSPPHPLASKGKADEVDGVMTTKSEVVMSRTAGQQKRKHGKQFRYPKQVGSKLRLRPRERTRKSQKKLNSELSMCSMEEVDEPVTKKQRSANRELLHSKLEGKCESVVKEQQTVEARSCGNSVVSGEKEDRKTDRISDSEIDPGVKSAKLPKTTDIDGVAVDQTVLAHSESSLIFSVPPTRQRRVPGLRKRRSAHSSEKSDTDYDYFHKRKKSPLASCELEDALEEQQCGRGLDDTKVCSDDVVTAGFRTAAGGTISISESALDRAKKLIEEDENLMEHTEDKDAVKDEVEGSSREANIEKPCAESKIATGCFKSPNQELALDSCSLVEEEKKAVRDSLHGSEKLSGMAPRLCGFQTAAGKTISVSKSALDKAREQFFEVEDVQVDGITNPNGKKDFTGFKTAAGEMISVSETALDRAKVLLLEEEGGKKAMFCSSSPSGMTQGKEAPRCLGFQTAAGRSISVSDSALARARQFLLHAEEEPLQSDSACLNDAGKAQEFSGFKTASGKTVSISEAALDRARSLVEEQPMIEERVQARHVAQVSGCVPSVVGFQTAAGNTIFISSDAMEKARTFVEEDTNRVSSFAGFQTAAGKAISISPSSLQRAKKFIRDDELIDPVQGVSNSVPSSSGFLTAASKTISFSPSSLERVKKLIDEESRTEGIEVSSPVHSAFVGFQTAAGKTISISSAALEKARKFVEEDPKTEESVLPNTPMEAVSDGFAGFQTASGKAISVSEASLERARRIVEEDPKAEGAINDPLPGFQTAAGKAISVSEASLERARRIVKDELDTNNNSLSRFRTAAEEALSIINSEEADARMEENQQTLPLQERAFGSFSTAKTPFRNQFPFSPKTFPRARIQSKRRPLSKAFKAPRKACNVSEAEERSSLARILRKFGTELKEETPRSDKQQNSREVEDQRQESGLSTASGKVSSAAVEEAELKILAGKENLPTYTEEAMDTSQSSLEVPSPAVKQDSIDESNTYCFSTQVVRQFLNFSSSDEEECREDQQKARLGSKDLMPVATTSEDCLTENLSPETISACQQLVVDPNVSCEDHVTKPSNQVSLEPAPKDRDDDNTQVNDINNISCAFTESMIENMEVSPVADGIRTQLSESEELANKVGEQVIEKGEDCTFGTVVPPQPITPCLSGVSLNQAYSSEKTGSPHSPNCHPCSSLGVHPDHPSPSLLHRHVLSTNCSPCVPSQCSPSLSSCGRPSPSLLLSSGLPNNSSPCLLSCGRPGSTLLSPSGLPNHSSPIHSVCSSQPSPSLLSGSHSIISQLQSPNLQSHSSSHVSPSLSSQSGATSQPSPILHSQSSPHDQPSPSLLLHSVHSPCLPSAGISQPSPSLLSHAEPLNQSSTNPSRPPCSQSSLSPGANQPCRSALACSKEQFQFVTSSSSSPVFPASVGESTAAQTVQACSRAEYVAATLSEMEAAEAMIDSIASAEEAGFSKEVKADSESGSEIQGCMESLEVSGVKEMKDNVIDSSSAIPRGIAVSKQPFPGLQTASGKRVVVRLESIRAARAVLGDSDVSPKANCGFSGLQKKVNISRESIMAAKAALGDCDSNSPRHRSLPGLQTASGKRIEVCSESIKAARAVLGGAEPSTLQSYAKPSKPGQPSFPGLQTASGKRVEVSSESIQAATAVLGNTEPSGHPSFPGLQTASGKKVEVSNESIKAARAVLGSGKPYKAEGQSSFPGLQTASGKRVEVSSESMKAARAVLGSAEPSAPPSFPGLQTASGKRVEVSSESIKAARAVLGSAAPLKPSGQPSFPGLQTASGERVEVSNESIKAARSVLGSAEPTKLEGQKPEGQPSFPGLRTASGKRVEVSSESIKAARSVLCNAEPTKLKGQKPEGHPSFPGLRTASGKRVEVNSESIKAVKAVLGSAEPSNPEGQPSFPGLQRTTAVVSSEFTSTIPATLTVTGTRPAPAWITPDLQMAKPSGYMTSASTSWRSSVGNSKKGLTSVPEVTLYDRAPGGRGYLPAQHSCSLPETRRKGRAPAQLHPPPSHQSSLTGSSNLHIFGKTTQALQAQHEDSFPHPLGLQPSTFARSQIQSQPVVSSHLLSHHSGSSVHEHQSSAGFSVNDPRTSYYNAHHSQGTSMGTSSSYTSFRKVDFNMPVKGVAKVQAPIWKGSVSGYRKSGLPLRGAGGQPAWSGRSNFPHDVGMSRQDDVDIGVDGGVTPLSLTLSQVCEMEESQPELDIGEKDEEVGGEGERLEGGKDGKAGEGEKESSIGETKNQRSDDSGYISHEISALKSPSPLVPDRPDELDRQDPNEDVMDFLFAEIAMEGLEDTLDPDAGEVDIPDGSRANLETTPDAEESTDACDARGAVNGMQLEATAGVADTCGSATTSENSHERIADTGGNNDEGSVETHQANWDNCDCEGVCEIDTTITEFTSPATVQSSPQPQHNKHLRGSKNQDSGSVKPRLGSLLSLRLQHQSSRVPLRDVVGHHPPQEISSAELSTLGVSKSVQSVTFENAENFTFSKGFFSSCALRRGSVCIGDGATLSLPRGGESITLGVDELWEAFRTSPGVQESLISCRWFTNHFKNLVKKLAAMEVWYPHCFAGRCLTPDWLMVQMKYRYDREIDRAERSAIHKICEHDASPSLCMVLYVSKIFPPPLNGNHPLPNNPGAATSRSTTLPHKNEMQMNEVPLPPSLTASVVVSDGWYSLPCVLDTPLMHMLEHGKGRRGKIQVGTKLMTCGAELIGLPSPCHPLEVPSSCHLKLSANSTRRARWDARLGFQPTPKAFTVPLQTLFPDGGKVGCTEAVIARVYPITYFERKDTGKKMRCERSEQMEAERHRKERERAVEKITSKIQRDFERESESTPVAKRRRRSRRLNALQIKQLQDGEEIHNALLNSNDPQALQEMLSTTQLAYLESYREGVVSQRQAELQDRIKRAISEADDVMPDRKVTPLQKIRLVPVGGESGVDKNFDCHLSFWNPDASLKQLLREGVCLRIYSVTASRSNLKYNASHLQLTANRSTRLEPIDPPISQQPACYQLRQYVSISDLGSLSPSLIPHRELDTVGVVALVHTASHVMSHDPAIDDEAVEKQLMVDTIFLTDCGEGILAIKVWGGLKCFGLEGVVSEGVVLALCNLSYKGPPSRYSSHPPPWATATLGDHTVVSVNPKMKHLLEPFSALRDGLKAVPTRAHLKEVTETIRTYL